MRTALSYALIALSAILGGTATAAPAEPPAIAAFFKRPQFREPRLSPSGRYLAVQVAAKNDRMGLAIIDLQTQSPPKFVAGFSDADVAGHQWVNEDRLVFQITNSPEGGTRAGAAGLWAVDRDGSGFRQLINSVFDVGIATQIVDRRLELNWTLYDVPSDGSNEVIVLRHRWAADPESAGEQLARLDTRTGRVRNLSQGIPDYVANWVLDWRGEPYAVETMHGGKSRFYKRDEQGRWQPWLDEDDYGSRRHAVPTWIGPDGKMLGTYGYRGYSALFQLDPSTGEQGQEPLVATPGYDYSGRLIFDPDARRLLGIRYETDATGTVWIDAAMKGFQADIDAKLPATVNLIGCTRCLNAMHLIVTSVSDKRPAEFYLYKPSDKSLQKLAAAPAELSAAAMGQRDYHRIKARDGLEMPVLVTQPGGGIKGRAPTIVLVHGGPYVRGTHWPWERNAQFLASRGYLVLEPEFRGSTGYGSKLFRAGWKQWGLAMQDDVADTLAWAVEQGWADPGRACIMGASYGGYAALMGAITQGNIFKCAVSWVGVTDIGLLSTIHWSDASDEWKHFGITRLVGDPQTDADQIRKTSPLQRAKEISLPLLVAYGGLDRRVPLKHGTDFKAALRSDQALEWVVYSDEGHGWFNLKTNEDFWGRVERFLAKHLAPPN
jgi:dienelactone hydrolase